MSAQELWAQIVDALYPGTLTRWPWVTSAEPNGWRSATGAAKAVTLSGPTGGARGPG